VVRITQTNWRPVALLLSLDFIIIFMFFLLTWIFVNSYVHAVRPFDPYPFINLVLLTIAALQAPVSMMSQDHHEARDRL
jgi:uncharacterized membrane protein